MATSPVVMMLLAWAALSERPQTMHLAGAGIGVGGVCLMLLDGVVAVDACGVLASITAMVMSSLGYVLAKKWSANVDVFSLTSWQLIAGGAALTPIAVATEGPLPTVDGPAIVGFGYVTVVATALAFAVWFTGLRHLSAGTVGLIGLLNPITGVLLGTAIAGEALARYQICGLVLVFLGILLGQPITARLVAFDRATRTDRCTPRTPAQARLSAAAGRLSLSPTASEPCAESKRMLVSRWPDAAPRGMSGRLVGGLLQGDEAGVCGFEPAGVEVEGPKMIGEVHVKPFAPGATGFSGSDSDEFGPDPVPPESRDDKGIEHEGMDSAVPRHIDEADEFVALSGADPSKTVAVHLRPPVVRQERMAKALRVQRVEFRVVEGAAPLVCNRHGLEP